jgi:hypothetical protein
MAQQADAAECNLKSNRMHPKSSWPRVRTPAHNKAPHVQCMTAEQTTATASKLGQVGRQKACGTHLDVVTQDLAVTLGAALAEALAALAASRHGAEVCWMLELRGRRAEESEESRMETGALCWCSSKTRGCSYCTVESTSLISTLASESCESSSGRGTL